MGVLKTRRWLPSGTKDKEDLQSISTERTWAPSLASKAAKGRPTTSELILARSGDIRADLPVDHCDDLSACSVTVFEHLVVDSNVLQDLDDGKRCAREDRLDGTGWRRVECAGWVGFCGEGLGDV